MTKITIRRADYRVVVPPSQGESEAKVMVYRWKVICPKCNISNDHWNRIDIVTWAKEWDHAIANAWHHIRIHQWAKDVAGQVMGDFEDTNLFRG